VASLPDQPSEPSSWAAWTKSDLCEARELRRLCQIRTSAEDQTVCKLVMQTRPYRPFMTCTLKRQVMDFLSPSSCSCNPYSICLAAMCLGVCRVRSRFSDACMHSNGSR